MTEREKVCILCGKREVMLSYICSACQERIQSEAADQRTQMRQQASGNIQGDDPDDLDMKQG